MVVVLLLLLLCAAVSSLTPGMCVGLYRNRVVYVCCCAVGGERERWRGEVGNKDKPYSLSRGPGSARVREDLDRRQWQHNHTERAAERRSAV